MKLRIQGNSLRLRLTQKEVALLNDSGRVGSHLEFTPSSGLDYLVEWTHQASAVTADFDGHAIRITLPCGTMKEWAESDEPGIEAESGAGLRLLIEKDFACLHKTGEPEPDAYPHPLTF